MAKKYRVKHYYRGGTYRARPHPLSIALIIIALAGLAFLGAVLYKPVSNFIMNIGKVPEQSQSEPELTSSSDSGEEPPFEPKASEPQTPAYDSVKAEYLPLETARDEAALKSFAEQAKARGANSAMLDIKDAGGRLLYKTALEKPLEWGAVAENPVDLKLVAETLKESGLNLVVRMNTFNDRLAARGGRLGYAIMYENTEIIWIDRQESPWLNPYDKNARYYLAAIALEAVEAGASMVVLESVNFPESSGVYATFGPDSKDIGRLEALNAFVAEMTSSLAEKGARLAVSLPSDIPADQWDVLYGGDPVTMLAQAAVITVGGGTASAGATGSPVDSALAAVEPRLLGADVDLIPIVDSSLAESARARDEYIIE